MAAVTAFQGVLEGFLPWSLFDPLEAGTRTFMFECPCGHRRDLWEAGGVKGGGNRQRTLSRCPACGDRRWHHKRKKTVAERRESLTSEGLEPVILSRHAWGVSGLAWGSAALIWSMPWFVISPEISPLEVLFVWAVSFVIGWLGPYFWATTRYRLARRALQLRSGFFGRDLDYGRITGVRRKRKRLNTSFAFGRDWLTVEYPNLTGGYAISPRDESLFLDLLVKRCPHLELRDGELRLRS